MNFLSHFFLHNKENDNYFTVGLTMPDLLGFHSKRIRITKSFLNELIENNSNNNIKSFASGMIVHLEIDKWFHNSGYFKEKMLFLQSEFEKFNNKTELLPQFYAHIIIEILIDRYLLIIEPDIADRFYSSYKSFNFDEAADIFIGLKNFDKKKFLSLSRDVANSSFLKEYIHDDAVINILKRVTKRINIPFELEVDDRQFAKFINYIFNEFKPSICDFINSAKKNIQNKDFFSDVTA